MEDKPTKNIESDEVSVRFDFSRHHAGSEVPDLLDSQEGMKISDDIPPLSYWRRSEAKDVKEIYKLFRVPYTREMFGIDIDVNRLVELSYISLSQFNTNEQLVAFISFCDYPNVPSVPSFCWLEWIHSLYRLEGVTTCNSLFIHLVVWSTNYANTALKTLLAALFMSHMRLKYVIMVVPPGATTSDIFDEYFTRICPIQLMSDFSKVQTLYICMRHQFVSELKIRLAMEEDNDDLMAIFNDMNHEICDKYGEYFFAELCIYGGSNRRIIVAEDNDRAIGIMCLNNDVNVSYLNENFELKPFNGLRKPWADTDLLPKQSRADAAKKSFSRYETARSFVIRESRSEISRSSEEEQESKISSDSSSTTTGTSQESIEVIPLRPSYTDMTEPDPLFATVSAMYMSEKPQTRAYDLENQKSWELEQEYLWMSRKGLIPTKKKFTERVSSEVCEMSNAFAVELYGLHKHYDERMSYDFLTSAFECFPYLDYCIITLPSTSRVFPLLQHFVRVSPKSESTFQHELYVAHRNSILCEPIIQEATKTDAVNIQYLLEGIQGGNKIYIDYLLAMNSPCHIKAFVFTNETTIVGLAIIRQVNNVSRLRATYSLDKIVEMKHHGTEQHGVIQHLVVSPIFQNHGRYFLKELHRLTGFTCLYYQLHSYEHDKGKYSIPSLLGYLIPVSPRQQVKFDFDVLGKNAPDKRLMQETVPYPLYHMNHRLSSHTKLDINTRIVIVGGTDIALSFIEHLIFGPVGSNFNINNLSLVSRHGVFTDHTFHPACEHFIPYNGHFNFTYLSRLHLQTWVNIIYGNMTAINRDKKFIKVNDESILYYDYLFLFCEEKFLKPNVHDGLEVTYHPEVCHNSMNCREEVRGPAEYPNNVFVINTPLDASFVLQKLHEMGDISQLTGYVIVYGHSYHAFCCIAALIEFGIHGKNIAFVEPFPDYKAGFTNTIFNNEEVDEAVINSIHEEGIVVYSGYFFHSWSLGAKDYSVQKVTFTKRAKVVSIDCIALFYYPKKSIEQFTFQAFREACLLFDGKLIIDHTFCTNDPSIFAAGNFTKYSDRYYSEPHSNFNPVEIGIEVANQLLKKLYHNHQEIVEEQPEVKLPPRFFSPIIISCKLPGSINYLHIRKPGLEIPMEAAISKLDYGKVYITGSCKNPESGYFRLHLDSYRFVRTITCYTKKEIDIYNLTCLYGKHERLLNNFVLRFENKLIPDLFQYFRQAWCYGIFHDYFHKVQKQNIDEISSIKGFSGKAIIEEIGQYLKQCDWKLMPDEKKEELYAWYNKSHLRQGVEQRMTTFLQDNIDLLPMYAAQRAVNRIFHMAPTSQLLQFSIHRN